MHYMECILNGFCHAWSIFIPQSFGSVNTRSNFESDSLSLPIRNAYLTNKVNRKAKEHINIPSIVNSLPKSKQSVVYKHRFDS